MRVIAGKARSMPLKTVEGMDTRPTTDRIKETLFNILQNDIYDCLFLDLFAGSGCIGIEALSRGAREAVFVEKGKAQADCIRENLRFTRLDHQAQLMQCDVLSALPRLEGHEAFDLIFMDAPYGKGLEEGVLRYISLNRPSCFNRESLFIMEEKLGEDLSYIEELGFEITRIKEYKTNMHVFFRLGEE